MVRIGKRRSLIALCCAAITLLLIAQTARAIAPSPIAPGDVNFTINAGQNVKAISPWIYGLNDTSLNSSALATGWAAIAGLLTTGKRMPRMPARLLFRQRQLSVKPLQYAGRGGLCQAYKPTRRTSLANRHRADGWVRFR